MSFFLSAKSPLSVFPSSKTLISIFPSSISYTTPTSSWASKEGFPLNKDGTITWSSKLLFLYQIKNNLDVKTWYHSVKHNPASACVLLLSFVVVCLFFGAREGRRVRGSFFIIFLFFFFYVFLFFVVAFFFVCVCVCVFFCVFFFFFFFFVCFFFFFFFCFFFLFVCFLLFFLFFFFFVLFVVAVCCLFIYFFQKIDFDISCKSSSNETISTECQFLFCRKNKKNIHTCILLKLKYSM